MSIYSNLISILENELTDVQGKAIKYTEHKNVQKLIGNEYNKIFYIEYLSGDLGESSIYNTTFVYGITFVYYTLVSETEENEDFEHFQTKVAQICNNRSKKLGARVRALGAEVEREDEKSTLRLICTFEAVTRF